MKRFCRRGHDTHVVGRRKSNRLCLICERINGRKNDKKRQHKPERIASRRRYGKVYRLRCTRALFKLLGDKCACCGEAEPLFLTIDHVNNDGHKESYRAKTKYYAHVKKNPKQKKYQILCWNCNGCKRVNNGVCVHKH